MFPSVNNRFKSKLSLRGSLPLSARTTVTYPPLVAEVSTAAAFTEWGQWSDKRQRRRRREIRLLERPRVINPVLKAASIKLTLAISHLCLSASLSFDPPELAGDENSQY